MFLSNFTMKLRTETENCYAFLCASVSCSGFSEEPIDNLVLDRRFINKIELN